MTFFQRPYPSTSKFNINLKKIQALNSFPRYILNLIEKRGMLAMGSLAGVKALGSEGPGSSQAPAGWPCVRGSHSTFLGFGFRVS